VAGFHDWQGYNNRHGHEEEPVSTQILRQFVPLNDLTEENLREIASKTPVEQLPKGKTLFRKGDRDNYSFYLLSGVLLLLGDNNQQTRLVGGTSPTRFPIGHNRPRLSTAIADSDVTFFRIDNDLLDILLTWDQNAGYMVSEIDVEEEQEHDSSDWMTMMLHSEIFHRIPPGNIQQVFMRMEPVQYKANETVITQGEDGDYYYFIKQGRVAVTHTTRSGKEIKLAELEAGSGFGEEALISDAKRNANVTMLTDGVLMRMAKEDFVELLKAPVLQTVDFAKAQEMVKHGALLLDVRLESEHKNAHLPSSINIPLYLLRIKARQLDKNKRYIVYCDTGRRSSSAAYLLNERGYDALYLEGGLRGLSREDVSQLKTGT
jgi:CRP-like cAMP-binding protein